MANSGQRCCWFCVGGADGGLLFAVFYGPLGLEFAGMTKDEALKLALEALGEIEWSNNSQWQSDRAKVAITAIKEALAQPEPPILREW